MENMNVSRNRFFIAFDISNDRRRARLVKILERFGVRSQYSLFEFYLTPPRKRELMADLEEYKFLSDKQVGEGILIVPIPLAAEKKIRRYGTTSRVYDEPCISIV